MKAIQLNGTRVVVEVSHAELHVIHQALNEVCNGIELFEFSTRMGAERDEVRMIMQSVGDILDQDESRNDQQSRP